MALNKTELRNLLRDALIDVVIAGLGGFWDDMTQDEKDNITAQMQAMAAAHADSIIDHVVAKMDVNIPAGTLMRFGTDPLMITEMTVFEDVPCAVS